MSVEMADQTEFDHSGLQEIANAMRETTAAAELLGQSNQKRKREVSDHDGSADATGRAGPKRVSSEEHKSMNEDNVAANAFMDSQHDQNAVDSLQEYSNAHDQSLGQNGADEHANASSTAAAALGMYPAMNMPPPGGVQFQTQGTEQDNNDTSFMDQSQDQSYLDNSHQQHQIQPSPPQQSTPSGRGANKPAVGSEEWHKVRKDNHKEVERRRRETINEGINELAKIVPGCEKNKGSILQRAVSFITQLKENEAQNIEKWTLEKLLTEQAIAELSASNDKLKAECERAWAECETWKKACQSQGLVPKEDGTEDK